MAIKKDIPILVVDDYKTMLRILSHLLSQIGFTEVKTALNGHAALGLLRDESFGLVISDLNMSPMDGFELLKEIRQTWCVPFLLVAPRGGSDLDAIRKAGLTNYIVKPFNAGMLKSKLATVLGEF